MISGFKETASRLCAQCGLCCNGVLFHLVQVKSSDSPSELLSLGMKLKKKKRKTYIQQPCPAHKESHCTIYSQRPERCRLFECRQIKKLGCGEIDEREAKEKIDEALSRVKEINAFLLRSGKTDLKRPLSKRCEKVLLDPDETLDPSGKPMQKSKLLKMKMELYAFLDAEFRLPTK